eukprot:8902407-Lingulodinium_polyedra.AAC.1
MDDGMHVWMNGCMSVSGWVTPAAPGQAGDEGQGLCQLLLALVLCQLGCLEGVGCWALGLVTRRVYPFEEGQSRARGLQATVGRLGCDHPCASEPSSPVVCHTEEASCGGGGLEVPVLVLDTCAPVPCCHMACRVADEDHHFPPEPPVP